jgi:phosphoglycolate phosphatase
MKNEFPRAVLFDFDGTLVDSYPAITASVNHVRAAYHLAPLSEGEVRQYVGRGAGSLLIHTVPGADREGAVALYRAHHPSVMRAGTRLMAGAAEVLKTLKAQSRLIGICSNKPRDFTRDLMEFLKLSAWVDTFLGPEDVRFPKPAPDMLQAALDRLDVPAGETVYVGDMVVDIETARAAGVRVWVVATGSNDRATLEAARPDHLLERLADLPGLLE